MNARAAQRPVTEEPMHRLAAPVAVGVAVMIVGLAACAARGTAGGPATPSPIAITANPSALPVGDTIPTGMLVGRKELVLYFWGTAADPFLDQAWRDAGTGDVELDNVCGGGAAGGAIGAVEPGRFFGLTQCVAADGTLIEYGAVWGEAIRITSQDAGATVEARYARWSTNRSITVFWLQRHGQPVPDNIPDGAGGTTPLPPERYPLFTAYDRDGSTIATERLRPYATEQKGG
jgi:hypothetical protein